MSNVFYTPPAADLQPATNDEPEFFTVAPRKLIVMMLLTHGLYTVYWFYQNWKNYGNHSGRAIWPTARTILAFFYAPSLFCKVDRACKNFDKSGMRYWALSSAMLILLQVSPFFIGLVYGLYLKPAGAEDVPNLLWLDFMVGTAALVLQTLIISRVQGFINRVNVDPNGLANDGYTVGNVIWISIGLLIWLVIGANTYGLAKM
ncbi:MULTISPECIES: hypothetical protein [unclassified Pseudomonas]|uniref:hypothetical protein n=1 Tax=unclassified Pseudomonas TaxID=196821 RepID=UPI000D387F7E|nr:MULTISPECIES: hypothetical protein [unclassified Pseudomonas]RAU43618.1 hypothetical protein DBP26_018980 [Pseudomonas sp. RIT 409]RAU54450.1 hypothetical protein DBY65_008990 [Pseudomonas sp. RIT 412]